MSNPRVFISYSWDSEGHKAWVLRLANRLRSNGVDILLDQYELKLGRNLTHYMERAVTDVDKVILILTENYKIKAEGREGGVGYEYSMINQQWYQQQSDNDRFIPILRSGTKESALPVFVNSYVFGDMREGVDMEKAYEELLRTIYDAPFVVKPELGEVPDFASDKQLIKPEVETPTEQKPRDEKPFSISDAIKKSKQKHEEEKAARKKETSLDKGVADFKNKLRMLIAQGEIQEVIDQLIAYANKKGDTDLLNTIVLQSSRLHRIQQAANLGTSSPDHQNRELARLGQALLSTIDKIR